VIFSRRGKSGRHAKGDDSRRSGPRHARRQPDDEPEDTLEFEEEGDDLIERGPGPYDISEAPPGVARLDLGSIQIPEVDGVEVRVQASQEGVIQQVVLVHGDSALQLGVFAAPRSEGIWDEVRTEMRTSFSRDGVAAEELEGEYGTELRARVRTPEGLTDLRFVGVDGPRWMVRAVYQGKAALDPAAAGPLAECFTGLVVDRGSQAMPAREALPLRLPRELAEAQAAAAAAETTTTVRVPPPEPSDNGSTPATSTPRRRPSSRRRRDT
jgi:hypothetical protein